MKFPHALLKDGIHYRIPLRRVLESRLLLEYEHAEQTKILRRLDYHVPGIRLYRLIRKGGKGHLLFCLVQVEGADSRQRGGTVSRPAGHDIPSFGRGTRPGRGPEGRRRPTGNRLGESLALLVKSEFAT